MKPVLFQISPIPIIDNASYAKYKVLSSPLLPAEVQLRFPFMPPVECLPEIRQRFQFDRSKYQLSPAETGSKRISPTNAQDIKVTTQSARIKLNFIKRKIQNLIASHETIHHKTAQDLLESASEYANLISRQGESYPAIEMNQIRDQLCGIVYAHFEKTAALETLCEIAPHNIPHIVNSIKLAVEFVKEVNPDFDISNLEYRLLLTRFMDTDQTFGSCLKVQAEFMKKLIQDLQIAVTRYKAKHDFTSADFVQANLTNLMRAQTLIDPWARWESLKRSYNSSHLGT